MSKNVYFFLQQKTCIFLTDLFLDGSPNMNETTVVDLNLKKNKSIKKMYIDIEKNSNMNSFFLGFITKKILICKQVFNL